MSTPGSRAMAAGLTVMLISVSTSMHFGAGGFGLLLCFCFMGVLVGGSLVAVGVRMADGRPPPIVPVMFGGARALTVFVRHNMAALGLFMASCAFTVISGEEDPMLCFGMFALLLLGLNLINIGARELDMKSLFACLLHLSCVFISLLLPLVNTKEPIRVAS